MKIHEKLKKKEEIETKENREQKQEQCVSEVKKPSNN